MIDINNDLPVWNKADALVRLMNNEGLLQRVITLFLSTAPAQLDELKSAAVTDLALTQRLAHSMKGICGNIGAEQMMNLCARLEQAAKAGDSSLCGQLATQMDEVAIPLLQQLQQ